MADGHVGWEDGGRKRMDMFLEHAREPLAASSGQHGKSANSARFVPAKATSS